MNRKQFILLLLLVAMVGAAGIILVHTHRDSWSSTEGRMGEKVLPTFQPNSVAAIRVTGANQLNIVRDQDVWHVRERDNYPANFPAISDTLIKLRDLKIVQSETVGPAQRGRVNLEEPGKGPDSGTLVEFKDLQGSNVATLLLGKTHARQQVDPFSPMAGTPDGRYILVPSSPEDVLLVSNSLTMFSTDPTVWISKEFFKLDRIKSIESSSTNVGAGWKIARTNESASWDFVDKPGQKADSSKTAILADRLAQPHFSDLHKGTSLDKPVTATVETFDNLVYKLQVGPVVGDGDRVITVSVTGTPGGDKTVQDKLKQEQTLTGWSYRINEWTVELLLCTRDQITSLDTIPTDTKPAVKPPKDVPGDLSPLLIK